MSVNSLLNLLNRFKKDKEKSVTITGRVKVNGKVFYFTDIQITNLSKYGDILELEIEDIEVENGR